MNFEKFHLHIKEKERSFIFESLDQISWAESEEDSLMVYNILLCTKEPQFDVI